MTGKITSDTPSLAEALYIALDSEPLRLPLLPDVAVRVREAVNDPRSGALALAEIVRADVALATRVIKLANSASFAGLVEIRDLPRAIARLGPAMLVAVAMGAAGKDVFRSKDPLFHDMLALAWHRSLLAGSVARRLADDTVMNREECFLAAMLHDVGQPVLLDVLLTRVAAGTIPRPGAEQLGEALRLLRANAGARLLEHWHMPRILIAAVRDQDDPSTFNEPQNLAGMLHACAVIAREHVPGPPPCGGTGAKLPPWLDLPPHVLADIVTEALGDYRELAQIL